MLYSESVADRGVARLISWFSTAEPVDFFNRVFEEYINLFQFLLVGYIHIPVVILKRINIYCIIMQIIP